MSRESAIKVLFADDDSSLRNAMRVILSNSGFEMLEASNGRAALEIFERENPDLVILDVMMPELDGFEACRLIRLRSQYVPILLLSARGEITDKKKGFTTGADGYLTKPFDQEELLLHINAQLRRASLSYANDTAQTFQDSVDFESLHIDFRRREAMVDGELIPLTPIEFGILAFLAEEPGKVQSRDEIAKRVWGSNYSGKEVAIPTHIRHLRTKLEKDPSNPTLIMTVGRFGYRLGS